MMVSGDGDDDADDDGGDVASPRHDATKQDHPEHKHDHSAKTTIPRRNYAWQLEKQHRTIEHLTMTTRKVLTAAQNTHRVKRQLHMTMQKLSSSIEALSRAMRKTKQDHPIKDTVPREH